MLATLGFRNDPCSAQFVAECTRTHKSTISRAVTALMQRRFIERVENENDRREFRLRLTRKGRALYEELFPRLLQREQEILGCLSRRSARDFATLLGKIEAEPRSGADQRRGGREGGVLGRGLRSWACPPGRTTPCRPTMPRRSACHARVAAG